MGTLPPTPFLGLVLPDPGTAEQHSTATQNGWFQAIDTAAGVVDGRVDTIEKYTNPAAALGTYGLTPRGTTAQRDALWTGTGTAAARVAQANKVPLWFNTDKGYTERYFNQHDDAGALLRNSAAVHGWYPAIPGELHGMWEIESGNISTSATLMPILTTGNTDPFGMQTVPHQFTIPVAGVWDLGASIAQAGTTALNLIARKGASSLSNATQDGRVGAAGAAASPKFQSWAELAAGDVISFYATAASGTVAYLGGLASVKYVRPLTKP